MGGWPPHSLKEIQGPLGREGCFEYLDRENAIPEKVDTQEE